MSAPKEKIYGIADKAWHPVVGCDPHMPCAPRCWARKTIARVVECQGDNVRDVFQIALTPDKQKWSGVVSLDEAHLLDPLKWRESALVASGFHGDIGRLRPHLLDRVFSVMRRASAHRFLILTKVPYEIFFYVKSTQDVAIPQLNGIPEAFPLPNVSIGASVMNQSEADKMRDAMNQISDLGWNTHVWYEPALGPVNWIGWEFLGGIIVGGESGADSRPANAEWFLDTRDFCIRNGIPFNFKQWGDWLPDRQNPQIKPARRERAGQTQAIRYGKKLTGRLLDGRTFDGIPRFGEVRA